VKNIGIYSYFGYALSFNERLNTIKNAGFDVTSIGLGEEEELVKSKEADLMPEMVRSKGLFIEYAHAPDDRCNDLWVESEQERTGIKKEYSSYIDYCKKHFIPILVIHVSRSKGDQPLSPTIYGLETLEHLAKYAETSNVRIAIENTRKTEYLDYIFSNIHSTHLGLCYDSSHDFLYSPQPGLLLAQWGHLLFATHISDNDGFFDRHWLPKEGIIRWEIIQNNFPIETYSGFLTLEIFPKNPDDEPASDFLKKAYGRIKWLEEILIKKPDYEVSHGDESG
jgi:sugar phosphate isomerase/epimerase